MKPKTHFIALSAITIALINSGCEQPSFDQPRPSGHAMKLNDTGVNYYGQHVIATTPGEVPPPSVVRTTEAPGQDADNGLDLENNFDNDGILGFSFTKLDASGNDLPDTAEEWMCVRDNVTKLVWEVKQGFGDHAPEHAYTWYDPDSNYNGGDAGMRAVEGDCEGNSRLRGNTYDFIQKVNAKALCGSSDWRLPLREEMRSIINYGVEHEWTVNAKGIIKYKAHSYLDEKFFPKMTLQSHRWTAESGYNQPQQAWAFHPHSGTSELHNKACYNGVITNGVILVRGPDQ